LVAKEVVDKEGFFEKFGLGFSGDVHWKAAPVHLDHLSRSPMFKAVLITLGKLPFKIELDIPEELRGRLTGQRGITNNIMRRLTLVFPDHPWPKYGNPTFSLDWAN